MKKGISTATRSSVHMSRDRESQVELADLARNGTPEDRSLQKAQADAEWSAVRSYPLLMLATLLALSAGLSGVCLSSGPSSYVALGVLALGLIGAVVLLNGKHRAAYVAKKMAAGMSREDAEREYSNIYDGS